MKFSSMQLTTRGARCAAVDDETPRELRTETWKQMKQTIAIQYTYDMFVFYQ